MIGKYKILPRYNAAVCPESKLTFGLLAQFLTKPTDGKKK
ncbi:hypothetical protein C943_00263 [Mariniradius saccharolyticus AK6]|uniref:Uncharacterized protein n=1 Tax=Mariniradius saccharolyticus AK6 TaxID=1239962 RepID=M7Y6Y4_9BACT|nr:hypothetical protein C943_00263 [Mariniradius saccharolyticus AK6]